jgi:putative transposase
MLMRWPAVSARRQKPKIGLRTTRADEMWHLDTTVIRVLELR